jgi:hypothetical protein
MPTFNPADGEILLEKLLAAGFTGLGLERFQKHVGAAGVNLVSHGVKVTIQKHSHGQRHTVVYTGARLAKDYAIKETDDLAQFLIDAAEHNKEIDAKCHKAIDSLLNVFGATGTNLEVRTKDLHGRQVARFSAGPHDLFYLSLAARSTAAVKGRFRFVAPYMYDTGDEWEEEEGPNNSFYFSNTAQLLAGIKELFSQPTTPRKYERVGNDIATLEDPGAFLDIIFEYGLSYVSAKDVDTFRTANCQTTNRLLDGEKRTIKLYALGFKSAPEKL